MSRVRIVVIVIAAFAVMFHVACGVRSSAETAMHLQAATMLVENEFGFAGNLDGSVRTELRGQRFSQLESSLENSRRSGFAAVAGLRAGAYGKVAGDALQEIGRLSELAAAYSPKDRRPTNGMKSIASAIAKLQKGYAGCLIVVAGYAARVDQRAALAMISNRCQTNPEVAHSLRSALDEIRSEGGPLAKEDGLSAVADACREPPVASRART